VRKRGKLYGIGLGPGNPQLLTLKAVQVLQDVAVIFVPRSDSREASLAREVVAPFINPNHQVQEFVFPMTAVPHKREKALREIALSIAGVLDEGRDAAFVTMGDSTLYSTFFYLLKELKKIRSDLEVETVPGITSFSAAAALLNRALAVGQESLAVIPATANEQFLYQVLSAFDNVVLLKVAPVLQRVLGILAELGRLEESAFVCRCGLTDQLLVDNLATAGDLPEDYFSLILVSRSREGTI
jgi:precorrin-2/cobalt-factor-2 C20-methyltransferase